MNEKEFTFTTLFNILKKDYLFNPRNFMTDFALGQIKAINNIFPECTIHSCFFHFSQAIWHNFKYPKSLWNYNDIITGSESIIKNFYFTNNICENINRYLNKNLKNGICSNYIFRNSILSVIEQFENKLINQNIENKKSDILSFYIKKEK